MHTPIIAIDIDDVLADYAAGFVKFSNARWGLNLTIADYDEHWGNVWGVDVDEVRRRADIMIDDLPKHCLSAVDHGVEALLFGDYTWNQNDGLGEAVHLVKDWKAVEDYFYG